MIICYKNYKRTDHVALCIRSVRYFYPDIEINLVFQYDKDPSEYDDELYLVEKLNVIKHYMPKKYNFGGGSGNSYNGFYFTEWINVAQRLFSYAEKAIVMDENVYFTTGQTLKWLDENDFDLAWYHWFAPLYSDRYWISFPKVMMAASLFGINFAKMKKFFPIPEVQEHIEIILGHSIHDKCESINGKILKIPFRNQDDHFGDGSHTNSYEHMYNHLKESGII